MIDAALGFRLHTGWAAAVVLTGSRSTIRVVDRRRFTLAEMADHDCVFVYHAAVDLDSAAANRHIAVARDVAYAAAVREVARCLADLKVAGYTISTVGLPAGAGRPLPVLADILRSHAVIHAAEADLFRTALADACTQHGLRVIRVVSKQLLQRAAEAEGLRPEEMRRRLAELRRILGPPWTVDQKEAALAALVAAAGTSRK